MVRKVTKQKGGRYLVRVHDAQVKDSIDLQSYIVFKSERGEKSKKVRPSAKQQESADITTPLAPCTPHPESQLTAPVH